MFKSYATLLTAAVSRLLLRLGVFLGLGLLLVLLGSGLVFLVDGSGFWLTTTKYLTPAGTPLHEKGLEPTVAVDTPDVEFGQPEPATDTILEKALEKLAEKKAA